MAGINDVMKLLALVNKTSDEPTPAQKKRDAGMLLKEQQDTCVRLLLAQSCERLSSGSGSSKDESAAQQVPDMPPGWTEQISKTSGKKYYFHEDSMTSQYTKPEWATSDKEREGLRAELKSVRAALDNTELKYKKLQEEIDKEREAKESLAGSLFDEQSQSSKVRAKLEEMQSAHAKKEKAWEAKAKLLQDRIESLETEVSQANADLDGSNAEICVANAKLDEMLKRYTAAAEDAQELKTQLSAAKAELRETEEAKSRRRRGPHRRHCHDRELSRSRSEPRHTRAKATPRRGDRRL